MFKAQTMEIKVIRSEAQYEEYLGEINRLIKSRPPASGEDAETIELLSVLIEDFENKKYPVEPPDPIDAITFKMAEQGLKQADLVPYFGTRSRVSEVLSRKRPLTVHMIRALSLGLGISTDTLIGLNEPKDAVKGDLIDWSRFPLREMIGRGWIKKAANKIIDAPEDAVKAFLLEVGFAPEGAAFKRSLKGDAYSPATKYALHAWLARIVQRSREQREGLGEFNRNCFSVSFLKELAQLSWFDQGPILAIEFLKKYGISVVIEPHLKGSMLDGAALEDHGNPIIGLTLRFDRLDNFWFTLLHEVAHIWKHTGEDEVFLDDLENSSEDRLEIEANRLAREAFIPRALWKRSEAFITPSIDNIEKLSRDLKIHPAIVAGRLRRDLGNFQVFGDLVGQNEVRRLFNVEFPKDSQ